MQNKVIWAEGILLAQQHFQQWEDFWQQQQWQLLQTLQPDCWGLLQLHIDTNALNNGNFRLHQCAGVFPDGLWFQHHNSAKILSRQLQLDPGEIATIYLAVADNQTVSEISGYRDQSNLARWQANYRQITDKYDSERQREILFGEINLKLLINDDFKESVQKIKIAQVKRESGGQYQLLPDFMATCLHIGAGSNLSEWVLRWQTQIKSKIIYLQERQLSNSSSHNPAVLKMLIILPWLHSIESQWYQFTQQKNLHPKEIFKSSLELIAILNFVTTDPVDIEDVVYLHDNLTEVFKSLEQKLFAALSAINANPIAKLKLQQKSENTYVVEDINSEILQKQQFFIAASNRSETMDWVVQFTRQIKIAAGSQMDVLMTSALSGVNLIHTQRPPPQMETKAGYEYFYLNPNNEAWQQIILERNLTIFVPKDFLDATIELVTI